MGERVLRIPEVARMLDLDGPDVYALIERGHLDAGKGQDGLVYVRLQAVIEYRERHATASS